MPRLKSLTKEEMAAFRDRVIAGSGIVCFQAFVENAGSDKAIQAIRPYGKHTGRAIACNGANRMGVSGIEPKDIVIPYYWMQTGLSNRNISPAEVHESGAIVELYYCAFSDAPPEFCIALSHSVGEGICEQINPDYEFIYTHHLSNGDHGCRYVIKKKSSRGIAANIGRIVETIPELDLPDEEVEYLHNHSMAEITIITAKALIDTYGSDKALEIVKPNEKKLGDSLGKYLIQKCELSNNLSDLEAGICSIADAIGQKKKRVDSATSEICYEVTDCPFKDTLGACRQFEIVMDGACQAINPDYEFSYTSMISRGDPICRWSIRKRGKVTMPSKVSETKNAPRTIEDLLFELKKRLVKGEITRQEYEELKKIVAED